MTYPSNSDAVAVDQLRAFVERVERIEEEIKALNTDKSELYAEAKGNGFDIPTIKKVVRIRKMDEADRQEADAMLALYLSALGMATLGMATPASDDEYSTPFVRVHAHVENIDEFDPETGEVGGEVAAAIATGESPVTLGQAANAGGENVADRPVHAAEEPGHGIPSVSKPAEGSAHSAPISEPALVPREIAEPGDRGAFSLAATVVPAIRPYNPGTHFLNKDNLMRLHGCLNPDMCGSSLPRAKLCFNCSVQHDGPAAPVAA